MADDTITVGIGNLTIDDVALVSRGRRRVAITGDQRVLSRVAGSREYVDRLIQEGERVYGVTTGFGGMSDSLIPASETLSLQESLIWFLKAGAGPALPHADVRASMMLRAHSLLRGVSGIRLEVIERFIKFLNLNATPKVRSLGSIGASGDLVPLAAIAGAIIGLDDSFAVSLGGEEVGATEALRRLGIERETLQPKEGLALVNGTSVMTGIAANCVYDSRVLMTLTLGTHALMFQAMRGNVHVLHPFIHRVKPHFGQVWVARVLFKLLKGSQWTQGEERGGFYRNASGLAQDRYSLRCSPQFMGPLIDGLHTVARHVETEANSATDNPLFDGEEEAFYEGGNFLGQYIGIAMDQLRQYIGLAAKHLDAQIAMLMSPEFSNGLPPSLVANRNNPVNMGLKGLQLTANSIAPQLAHLGTPLVDRFPTHAEQFNQNINSLGFGAANLARESVSTFRQYMATALLIGTQAVDLRARHEEGHFDARPGLSPGTLPLYNAIYDICGQTPGKDRALIQNDVEQSLESYISAVAADIAEDGRIPASLDDTLQELKNYDVPAPQPKIKTHENHTMNVAQNIARGRALFPKKVALIFEDQRYTYAELDEWSSRIANGLASLGAARGDRVALFLPNIPEFAAVYLAIQKLGAIAVSLNTTLRAGETAYILEDSGSAIVFTTEALRGNVNQEKVDCLERIVIAEGKAHGEELALETLAADASSEFDTAVMDQDDPSAILYTSGTTGNPKGACLSHGNVISNMYSFNHNCRMTPDDRLLLFLPLFHCFGQNAIMNSGFNACATIVLHRNFDPAEAVGSIAERKVTLFFGVPTTFLALYNVATVEAMRSLRYYFSAAATLPREIARKWQEKFNFPINEGYGLTETSPFASYNHHLRYMLGSIGSPIENVEMRIVDVETGAECTPGDPGEIVVRGPNVMLGYWNRDAETKEAIRDGWFHTGDVGRVDDDGYFYIVDRMKDMINVGGLKVYPVEVENIIYQHSSVEEVAVYGKEDSIMGECVCANIVLKEGQQATDQEILSFCREHLADYKVPVVIRFVDSVPKSPTGKILKRILRESEALPAESHPEKAATAEEIDAWMRNWIIENLPVENQHLEDTDGFFELGMSSIFAMKLSDDLGAWLGRRFESDIVWENNTVSSLAAHVAGSAGDEETPGDEMGPLTDEAVAKMLEEEAD